MEPKFLKTLTILKGEYMKTILITGGAGFIGSHLCKKLSLNNYIICLDNLFTGKIENIYGIPNVNIEFIRHDVIEPIMLEVDEIYHLACPASPIHYQFNPIKTIKTNILGTMNMLGLAKRIKARIVFTSTSEIYGNPLIHPQTEDYFGNVNNIGTRSCYDEGKRVAETLCMDYHREHNVNIGIARLFNSYGPNLSPNDGRVVSNFINQALDNKDITVYGTGDQTRSFCYIDDMVNGLISLMESGKTGPYNLGNPDERTIFEIAELIISLVNSNSKIVFSDLPSDDPAKRKPDITKAKNDLNWEPVVPLEKGLNETIDYFYNLKKYKKS